MAKRAYPHLPQIQDRRAADVIRILLDRTYELEDLVAAANARIDAIPIGITEARVRTLAAEAASAAAAANATYLVGAG